MLVVRGNSTSTSAATDHNSEENIGAGFRVHPRNLMNVFPI